MRRACSPAAGHARSLDVCLDSTGPFIDVIFVIFVPARDAVACLSVPVTARRIPGALVPCTCPA